MPVDCGITLSIDVVNFFTNATPCTVAIFCLDRVLRELQPVDLPISISEHRNILRLFRSWLSLRVGLCGHPVNQDFNFDLVLPADIHSIHLQSRSFCTLFPPTRRILCRLIILACANRLQQPRNLKTAPFGITILSYRGTPWIRRYFFWIENAGVLLSQKLLSLLISPIPVLF